MNDIFKLRNTDRLIRKKYKLNLKILESSHFWNKKPNKLRSENMECLTPPSKNFR